MDKIQNICAKAQLQIKYQDKLYDLVSVYDVLGTALKR